MSVILDYIADFDGRSEHSSTSDADSTNRVPSLTLDLTNSTSGEHQPLPPNRKRMNRQTSSAASQDLKIVLVWLERMEDNADLPLDELVGECLTGLESGGPNPTSKDALVIFVQPLKNGLLRIKMQGQTVK